LLDTSFEYLVDDLPHSGPAFPSILVGQSEQHERIYEAPNGFFFAEGTFAKKNLESPCHLFGETQQGDRGVACGFRR
jgi:hypothetical protein